MSPTLRIAGLLTALTVGGVAWLTMGTSVAWSVVLGSWILFALIAAAGDALVGFIDEWLLTHLRTQDSYVPIDAPGRLVLISGFFGGAVALAAGAITLLTPSIAVELVLSAVLLALLAGCLEVVWMIPYFYALDRGGAVSSTPLFQTIPIFSLVLGVLIFAEVPSVTQIIAALLIVCGGVLLNFSPRDRRFDVRTFGLMLGASAVISLGYFCFKEAAEASTFITAVIGNGLGMFLLSLCLWIGYRPFRVQFNAFLRTARVPILVGQVGNESLYALSTLAAQYAIVLGPSVMLVTAFNAFHPLFTLVFGAFLTWAGLRAEREEFHSSRISATVIGIGCIAAGAAVIVL